MAFDFPANPPEGQIYVGPNGVTFTWNGYAWIKSGDVPSGAGYVLRTGDVMTGFLLLPADPISPMHAVTKQYVDAAIAAAKET